MKHTAIRYVLVFANSGNYIIIVFSVCQAENALFLEMRMECVRKKRKPRITPKLPLFQVILLYSHHNLTVYLSLIKRDASVRILSKSRER